MALTFLKPCVSVRIGKNGRAIRDSVDSLIIAVHSSDGLVMEVFYRRLYPSHKVQELELLNCAFKQERD